MLEETGLDIAELLGDNDYIDAQLGDQDTRLFIVQVRSCARPTLPGEQRCVCKMLPA